MIVMSVLSLDHWNTNVKGHNDININSSAKPIFFPERLQSDVYRCSWYLSAHAYMAYLSLLHYIILYEQATRDVVIFMSEYSMAGLAMSDVIRPCQIDGDLSIKASMEDRPNRRWRVGYQRAGNGLLLLKNRRWDDC